MNKKKLIYVSIITIIVIGLIIGGTFFFNHKKQETFYKEYNLMNENYKTVLFATGQDKNESNTLFEKYLSSWNIFYDHYKNNPIKPYNADQEWSTSLDKINTLIIQASELIGTNELHEAHLQLEEVRQEWQNIFKRNDVSMIGFYMTEFHDVMEKAVDGSENPNFYELNDICTELNEKWAQVESVNLELSGDKINDYNNKKETESNNLKKFCDAVSTKDDSKLVELSGKLKKDFISIYLIYGWGK